MLLRKASKKHVNEEVAKSIHEKVAPVVNWLRTAEEETSEEEEEDVEVVYSDKVSGAGIITETIKTNGENQDVPVDEELDIDAI